MLFREVSSATGSSIRIFDINDLDCSTSSYAYQRAPNAGVHIIGASSSSLEQPLVVILERREVLVAPFIAGFPSMLDDVAVRVTPLETK